MRIREAEAGDLAAIGSVVVETWRSTYRGIMPDSYLTGLSPTQRADQWRTFLAAQGGTRFALVAHDAGDDVVAFAAGGPERSGDPRYRGELYAIYVIPAHQARGIGRALMHAVAGRLAAAGHKGMLLWVLEANAPARAFYAALGGVVVRRQSIDVGGVTLQEVAYGWDSLELLLKAARTADDEPAWKARFRVPVIRGAQVAAGAPERGLIASDVSGTFQLHAWDVPSGRFRALTNRPTGVMAGLLSPDGRSVYYHDDTGGNELGHFVRIPFDGGEPVSVTPDMPPYPTFGLAVSGQGNRLGFISADGTGYHLHMIVIGEDGSLGSPQRIHSSERFFTGLILSHDGAIAVVAAGADARSLQFGLVALDMASGRIIEEITDGDSRLGAVKFAPIPGDGRLLAFSNRTGLARPVVLDLVRRTRTDLELDGLEGEVYPADWSADGHQVLLEHVAHAVQHLLIYDVAKEKLTALNHPNGTYGEASFARDGAIHIVWEDSTHPPQVIALDPATGMPMRTLLPKPDIPPCRPWRSVSFASSDRQQIQGWLAVPGGAGPFPTILHVHGGPEAAMTEVFLPSSQSWLDHGFAFLSINYRGSTTFGRVFLEQIWGNLGRWEVEDMVAAREWLVTEGIADPARVLVTGWSYGGYLTLQALGTRPDLWAAGMAGIAVADWAIAHEDTTATLRGWRAARFGGTPEEVPERYAASSPITYAQHVKAPVMIIQGRNDTRTPPRSVELYETRMKALGKAIEVHWFDAGHGSLVVDQAIEHHELMLRFAQRVLRASAPRVNPQQ